MRRAVITGMGIVSSIGNNVSEALNSLKNGISGIEFVPERKELGFRSALSGTVKDFVAPDIEKKYLRQMGMGAQLAVHAVKQALSDAGWEQSQTQSDLTSLIIGNTGNMQDIYYQCDNLYRKKKKLGGTIFPRVIASTVSANLSVWLKTRGHAMTVSAACASGSMAIGQGYYLIRSGLQDRAICGGIQEYSWESICGFDALRAFSLRENEPTMASRPFDVNRDGLVPSCGAGIVVLEEYETAIRRGARIYAELIGYAANSDGFVMTIPSGDGCVKCMELALKDAGITAGEVEYVNAHATSTRAGDAVEARGIARVFGHAPQVSSTKSMTGHELGAAGSTELIYSLLMMEHDFVAPTINLEKIDPECNGINIVANEAKEAKINTIASNSFGFGGVNTCLICRKLA